MNESALFLSWRPASLAAPAGGCSNLTLNSQTAHPCVTLAKDVLADVEHCRRLQRESLEQARAQYWAALLEEL